MTTLAAAIQILSLLVLVIVIHGAVKKVKIYEAFVEGAREGFNVGVRIIPYLVAMLVAIGIFRAGGAMDFLTVLLSPLTRWIGLPAETLPMAPDAPLIGQRGTGSHGRDPQSPGAGLPDRPDGLGHDG